MSFEVKLTVKCFISVCIYKHPHATIIFCFLRIYMYSRLRVGFSLNNMGRDFILWQLMISFGITTGMHLSFLLQAWKLFVSGACVQGNIFATRQRSWGKVMFSLMSVSLSVHNEGGFLWYQVPSGGVYVRGGYPPPRHGTHPSSHHWLLVVANTRAGGTHPTGMLYFHFIIHMENMIKARICVIIEKRHYLMMKLNLGQYVHVKSKFGWKENMESLEGN